MSLKEIAIDCETNEGLEGQAVEDVNYIGQTQRTRTGTDGISRSAVIWGSTRVSV